jgi:RNA polymerase sigma-70 factor, ECF subfamily
MTHKKGDKEMDSALTLKDKRTFLSGRAANRAKKALVFSPLPNQADPKASSYPDYELISRCQKGDRQAFEEIYLRYHRGLFLFLLSMFRCRYTAEDVVQDVFVKLFSEIKSFRFQSSFSRWLYRVARNAALDKMRHEKIRRARSLDEENEDQLPLLERLPDSGPAPSAKAENDEKVEALDLALSRLPGYARKVLLMREWEELNYGEIADKLGISLGTVKSRLFRGRRLLALQMKDSEFAAV